jgi:hypothetical protein
MIFMQKLIKCYWIEPVMKISHRNLAMILMGVIVMSTSGVYSLTQSVQTQTSSGTTEQPVVLGHIEAIVKDPNGNIKAYRQTDNLVVSNGLNSTINALFGSGVQTLSSGTLASTFKYVGVGTSNTAVTSEDLGLNTQRGLKHLGVVTAITASGGTGMGAQIVANWPAGILANSSSTSTTIQEAGLFDSATNATSASNMYAHQVISPGISMGTGDTLAVTWKITFSHS